MEASARCRLWGPSEEAPALTLSVSTARRPVSSSPTWDTCFKLQLYWDIIHIPYNPRIWSETCWSWYFLDLSRRRHAVFAWHLLHLWASIYWVVIGWWSVFPTRPWSPGRKRPHLFSQHHLWHHAQYLTRGHRGHKEFSVYSTNIIERPWTNSSDYCTEQERREIKKIPKVDGCGITGERKVAEATWFKEADE